MTIKEQAEAIKGYSKEIDDAILSKGGETEGGLKNAAAAIEAIPSGGVDLGSIKEAVRTMDGITRGNPDGAELARAITEITRQPNRRGETVAAEPEWTAAPGKTAFVVKVDESVGLDFVVGCLWLKSDATSVTIDWGDESEQSVVSESGAVRVGHAYAEAGCYLVQISDHITRFLPHLNDVTSANFSSSNGRRPQGDWCTAVFGGSRSYAKANNDNIDKVYRVIQWGTSITNASYTYSGCAGLTGTIPAWGANITLATSTYYDCSGLTGVVPEWGAKITSASNTYNGCSGLTGVIPAWGAKIKNAQQTYSGCSGLTGAVPAWGDSITTAYGTYSSCSGLTGEIPAWGAEITTASLTYSGCTGLTGAVPEWGAKITSVTSTYYNCSGLTGTIPAWGAEITNAQQTYQNCYRLTGAIPAWGAKIENAQQTYFYCSGLTGAIPAWGAKISNAQETYRWCFGLTSIWGVDVSDSDRMPSRITSKSNCVNNTSKSLRDLFLAAWGGTRAS